MAIFPFKIVLAGNEALSDNLFILSLLFSYIYMKVLISQSCYTYFSVWGISRTKR